MRIILFLALALIVSCSTAPTFNETAFPYEYNEALVKEKPIRKVILAPASLGTPAPSYLRKAELRTRARVRDYLQSHGFEVLPDYHFDNAKQQASRTYGNFYDPTTGRIDANTWKVTMVTIGEKLRESTDADAIIFADLFALDVQHSASFNHYARWDGVARKPAVKGAGNLPADFNWSQPIKAATLVVNIYTIDLNRVFTSRGGIDTLYELDTKRATPSFTLRKKQLKSESFIEEGIQLAFHPFIPIKNYPDKKTEVE